MTAKHDILIVWLRGISMGPGLIFIDKITTGWPSQGLNINNSSNYHHVLLKEDKIKCP